MNEEYIVWTDILITVLGNNNRKRAEVAGKQTTSSHRVALPHGLSSRNIEQGIDWTQSCICVNLSHNFHYGLFGERRQRQHSH